MEGNKLHDLFSRPERPYRSRLSVYLDIDQSRPSNLNRGFETQLRNLITSIRPAVQEPAELEKFIEATNRITGFVSAYEPSALGLGLFFDQSDGFLQDVELDLPVRPEARWDRQFFVQPLASALDQMESYGVVMLDKLTLRLFTVFLGQIEEHVREGFGPDRVRHVKASGTDHIASSSHIQRKADEKVRLNLKHMVKMTDWLVQSRHLNRLIIAGKREVAAELRDLLPKRLAALVIGEADIAIDAAPSEILAVTQPIAQAYERIADIDRVNQVVTTAAKTEKAVAGLGRTLQAIHADRVWQLVYSEDFRAPGFECGTCGGLFSVERSICQYCGGTVEAVPDVVERAVEHTLRNGAQVEVVTGEAAASLASAGGIAAFLKVRTGTVQL